MIKNPLLQPFLKWAGGKRQLLTQIKNYMPGSMRNCCYYEPFLGGGAVLFGIQPQRAVVNDINPELYNCYVAVRDYLDELIAHLEKYTHKNNEEDFYEIRDLDRREEYKSFSPAQKAARIIFLNKTCYNGLFRVNSQGQFNVPFGKYKNPRILDTETLKQASRYLANNNIELKNTDFEQAIADAQKGDFIYFDPPYDPVSCTSSFTGYSMDGFGRDEQLRLRNVFVRLDKKGCRVLLSNSSTEFIGDLYSGYNIVRVSASRNINSVAAGRGKIDEVLVMNYGNKKR